MDVLGLLVWVHVVPEPQDGPSGTLESNVRVGVTGHLSDEFRAPPFPAVGQLVAAFRATVPEAAVDEGGDARAREGDANSSPTGSRDHGSIHAAAKPCCEQLTTEQ